MGLKGVKHRINKNIPTPFYYQVRRVILNELPSGSLKQEDRLPGEAELCERLGLSRPTVRQTLDELVPEEVLVWKKKSGTSVARPKIGPKTNTDIEHLKRYLEMNSKECGVGILDLCVIDGIKEVNQRLGLESHNELIYLKRIWKVGGTPIVYNATYLSSERSLAVFEKDFQKINLLGVLEVEYDTRAKSRAVKIESTLVSKYDLELLEIDRVRASLLRVTNVIGGEGDRPLCYLVAGYRDDKSHILYDCEVQNIEV